MRGRTRRAATDRHVQPQRACRPIAEAVDHIQRRLDLPQRRTEPIEKPRACFGRRDAARGAVEQPDAELGFEPAHGFAEARGAAAVGPRRLAKAARARHRYERREVAEVRRHCSPSRTACFD